MKDIKVGKHIVPLWLIAILSVSGVGIGALTYHVWNTLMIPIEVKEPLEILDYPSKLSLYPGEIEEFNVTLRNHSSVNYSVELEFSLDNATYQNSYVTFSYEIYKVIPGEQNLTAWLKVVSYAPPINTSLSIEFRRTAEQELFFDDFNDGLADGWTEHLGTWNVIEGEYFVTVGLVENAISTVNGLNLTDCVIEAKLRFKDTEVGFRAGIVFKYINNEKYYSFELSNEYDKIQIHKYTPQNPDYGENISFSLLHPINANVDYILRIEIRGSTFTGYLNGQQMVMGIDDSYIIGEVGFRARRADVFFDDFKVMEIL